MKKIFISIFLCICYSAMSQIIVHPENPSSSSAILEVSSTSGGLLIPRMTEVQMNAISNPAEGLMVFCTDCTDKSIYFFNSTLFVSAKEDITASVTSFPVDSKIYKRDKSTNLATLSVEGSIHQYYDPTITSVLLEIYKDNVLINTLTETLSGLDADNKYNFSFAPTINAELAAYDFILKTDTGLVLEDASDVMAGDIYIVTGQSNSVWSTNGDSNFPTSYTSPYIKTFGGSSNRFSTNLRINANHGIGGIGYWFAKNIVDNEGVPVLVLNGGHSGKHISFFQRNDGDKYNSGTNYGLLLTRFSNAGYTASDVTSVIWYQGESDNSRSLTYYNNLFDALRSDWEEDYNPDHYYIMQVHFACGINISSQIPEAHRQLGLTYADITTVSTNGALLGSDNCHYAGTNGYEVIGERVYNLLDFKYYNLASSAGIYSPDVTNVKFGDAANTSITFDLIPTTDTFSLGGNINDDFVIEGSSVTVTGVSVIGNTVTLSLSGSVVSDDMTLPKLTYLGNKTGNTLYLFNQNNIGMLSFKDILISPF